MTAEPITRTLPSRFMEHIRLPLYRNGYALILSSGATSALGFFYWILVARLYPTAQVGLNAAVLSASLFISTIAQFNLTDALIRFLPTAGRSTGRFILVAYGISTAVIGAASLAFLWGISWWAPELRPFVANPWNAVGFIGFTAAYGIFALQDSALTGIRQAVWVPLENTIFAALKIALLFIFAGLALEFGILGSWMVPSVLVVLAINGLLFGQLVPRHSRATAGRSQPASLGQVARFVTGDYLGGLFWVGITTLQTVVIAQVLGTAASAHFYLVWQVAYGLYLVSRLMGMSLVAEVATDPAKLGEYRARALKQMARIILPVVALLLGLSPWLLRLYGAGYAESGATLLRLLALSAIPQMVIALALSIARIQRKSWALFMIQAAESLATALLIPLWLPRYGLAGLGWAWLLGQVAVALGLSLTQARGIWGRWARPGRWVAAYQFLRRPWWRVQERRLLARVNQDMLPVVAPLLRDLSAEPSPWPWRAASAIPTVTDASVIALSLPGQAPSALLKLARTPAAAESLLAQWENLAALRQAAGAEDWPFQLPRVWLAGSLDRQAYSIEAMLPGEPASAWLAQPGARQRALEAAASAIAGLHLRTIQTLPVDQALLDEWVDQRLAAIQGAAPYRFQRKPLQPPIDRLRQDLSAALRSQRVAVAWIHGDFSPGNTLLAPGGAAVLSLIDWDCAALDLPQLDLIHFLISTRMIVQNREMGEVMIDLLDGEGWSPEEKALLLSEQRALPGNRLDGRTLLLLAWLRHVAANLTKSSRYQRHWLWFDRNVARVLRQLDPQRASRSPAFQDSPVD